MLHGEAELADLRDFDEESGGGEGAEDAGEGDELFGGGSHDELEDWAPGNAKKKKGRPQGSTKKSKGAVSLREKKIEMKEEHRQMPKAKPKKSRRGKSVNGFKYCVPCKKWLPMESFPSGSAQCAPDRQAIQSLRNAAVAQNEMTWFNEAFNDDDKLAKVVKNYHARIAGSNKKSAKSAGQFPILTYIEEVRQETALILEGLAEMMPL